MAASGLAPGRPTTPAAWLRLAGAAAGLALLPLAAAAQGLPPPPAGGYPAPGAYPSAARSPACQRLEGQLADLDRGGNDARAEQIRRYEEAATKQQYELDRSVAQQRRLGCQGGSFFFFGGGSSPQCDQLNGEIQRMRGNLDRMLAGLQQLQGTGGGGREEQRRGILIALGQNDCGPQYRSAAAPQRSRGLFDSLFGSPDAGLDGTPGEAAPSGTFRTVCVRTCDGYYFPISYATVPGKFAEDERTCQRMCPAAEVALYAHRNPGEDIRQAMSIAGRPYSELPSAFRYRQEINAACSCKRPGESWAQTLGQSQDDTVQRGDIVVTDENAKALSQPRTETQGRQPPREPSRARGRTGEKPAEPAAPAAPPAQAQAPAAAPAPAPAPGEKPRSVGPQFYPVR